MAATITIADGRCHLVNEPDNFVPCQTPITTASIAVATLSVQAPPVNPSAIIPPAAPTSAPKSPASSSGSGPPSGVPNPQNPQPTPGAQPPLSSPPLSPSASLNETLPGRTSPSAASNASSNSNNDGLRGGAVAGVAIGMLLAGILIAGAIFFFLLRRQKRRQTMHNPISHLPPTNYGSSPEKGPVVVARAAPSSIDSLLPQPASDDEIRDYVSKIRDSIKNHVRTFCHTQPLETGINEAALRNVTSATGLSSSVLTDTLINPITRPDTLRLIVAWVVLSKCTGGRNAGLLPSHLAILSAAMPGTTEDSTQDILYSKWKAITGALMQPEPGKSVHDPSRAHNFAGIVAELDSILGPFVKGALNGEQRQKNLDMILTRSANLAFLLFAQPGSFQFEFASRRGGLFAFPALLQTIGDDGRVLSSPRSLSEGETAAVISAVRHEMG